MNVRIEHRDVIRVVGLAHSGPYPNIGSTFGRLMGMVQERGIPMDLTIAIYHDDPGTVPDEELRSDACLVVASDFTLPDGDELRVIDLPAGDYAVAVHQGSYAGLPAAWNEVFMEHLPKTGRSMAPDGLCYERYLNDCSVVPESEVLTEIVIGVG